jgi:predicted DNA-binding protein
MSDITRILADASDDAERNRDQEPPAGIRPQRRAGAGSPAVLSVRLTAEQYQQLAERAAHAGRPISAEARDIILAALGESEDDHLGVKLEQVLRRTLAPQVLADA